MHLLLFAEAIQLFPDGTLFIHVGLILLMIFVLNRTLYRPINNLLHARERSKGGHASEADGILADVAGKEIRYTKEILEARSEGYSLIEKEQKDAAALREKQIEAAKAETGQKLESGRAEIEQQAAEARAAIGTEAEKMADRITAGILKV
ncbi:MAG: hypothetical protein WKF34_00550 [Pyrinomonadaceae bacterium]